MPRPILAILLLLCSAAAFAQSEETRHVAVMVPVVGRVWGASGVHWRTDLELVNDTASPESILLSLPTAPDQPFMSFDLPPHGTQRFNDVIGQLFGLDRALSPLMVQTEGIHSVRVNASVYAVQGDRVTSQEPIAIAYTDVFFPIRALYGLTFSDAYRTNIGLANLNDQDALFTIALQHVGGRNIAVTQLQVPANTLWHASIQSLFPLITKGEDFSVLIETGSRDTYVYGSVIANGTNEARFIQPSLVTQ
jgi:hypothetical protein